MRQGPSHLSAHLTLQTRPTMRLDHPTKTNAPRAKLLGVRFDLLNSDLLRLWLSAALRSSDQKRIAFSNPEFVVEAQKNDSLRHYLNSCDLNLIDGVGVMWGLRLTKGQPVPERLTGTNFVPLLCEEVRKAGARLFLLGGKPGVAARAQARLEQAHPGITICGVLDGYSDLQTAASIINAAESDVVMVCLGNPRQEEWISENRHKLSAKLLFGNGGAIDFWAGDVPIAPRLIQRAGFEWLFRLITNFSAARVRRQARLVSFVGMVIRESLSRAQ